MTSYGQKLIASWRMILLVLLFTLGTGFLERSLYKVQVERFSSLSSDQRNQSMRRVQIPGTRGRIFDRNGVLLADNRPSYCIVYYVQELRRRGRWQNTIDAVDADVDRLARELGIERVVSRRAISNHVMQSLPMPLLAWRDVSFETMSRWAEAIESFPGVDILDQPERRYPHGKLAAHVLGYVGRDRPQPLPGQKVHFYLPEMIGKNGIESQYNAILTGVTGGELIQVDSRGYKHAVHGHESAVHGMDISLTLDVRVQAELERQLRGWRGAGVVLDPRNGEVLAMASSPAYDPNDFVPIMPQETWSRLNADQSLPLINRAIQGWYAPGSVFKGVTAMAAFSSGKFDPLEPYLCKGCFQLGSMRLRCWDTYGHGTLSLHKAIEQSCNSYFSHLANEIGYEPIYQTASQMGVGKNTGIDLPAESAGLLPTEEWKEKRLKDRWRPGDTCQIAIGQGLLITTPIQMAVVAAMLANGGRLYRPHLARSTPPALLHDMKWREREIEAVRQGMRDVVVHGTGRRLRLNGVEVAGKTGTAEVDSAGGRRKNAWVIAFAPYEKPTVALALMVENGESGGLTAAPLARDLLMVMFEGATPYAESLARGGGSREVIGD